VRRRLFPHSRNGHRCVLERFQDVVAFTVTRHGVVAGGISLGIRLRPINNSTLFGGWT